VSFDILYVHLPIFTWCHNSSVSPALLYSFLRWRRISRKTTRISGIPSVYFEGKNYLLKMASDTATVLSVQTMKMWLGFEANSFMIPPAYHNPHRSRIEREERRRDWIRGRDSWMQDQLLRLKAMTTTGITMNTRVAARSMSIAPTTAGSSRKPSVSNSAAGGGMVGSQSTPVITQGRVLAAHQSVAGAGLGLGASASALELGRTSARRDSRALSSSRESQHSAKSTSRGRGRPSSVHSTSEDEEDEDEEDGKNTAGKHSSRGNNQPSPPFLVQKEGSNDEDDEDEDAMRAPKRKTSDSDASASAKSSARSEEEDSSVAESDTSSSLAASSSVYSQADEDWALLRDQCVKSWPSPEDPEADQFWKNYDLNPLTVEASVCFVDAFPAIFVVPPVQLALANRCSRCETILRDEEAIMQDAEKLRTECRQYKNETLSDDQLQIALEEIDTEEKRVLALIQQQLLASRQQNSNVRDNLHFQYIPLVRNFPKRRGQLRRGGGSLSRAASPSKSSLSPTRSKGMSRGGGSPDRKPGSTDNSSSSNPFSVFLTATGEEGHLTTSSTSSLPKYADLIVDIETLRLVGDNALS
jgi:hypothetical protein